MAAATVETCSTALALSAATQISDRVRQLLHRGEREVRLEFEPMSEQLPQSPLAHEPHGKACSRRSARVSPDMRQGIPSKRCWDCWDWVPGRPASERAVAKFIECLPCLPQTIHLRPTSCTKGYTPRYTPVYARVYPGQGNIYQIRCSLKACFGRPTTLVRRKGCLFQGDLVARRAPGDPPEDTRVYAWVYPQSGAGIELRGGLHQSALWQSA